MLALAAPVQRRRGDKDRDGKLLVKVCGSGTLRLLSSSLILEWVLSKECVVPVPDAPMQEERLRERAGERGKGGRGKGGGGGGGEGEFITITMPFCTCAAFDLPGTQGTQAKSLQSGVN
jgi:hypothetical protein